MKMNPLKNIITFNAKLPAAPALAEHLAQLPFVELGSHDYHRAGFVAHPVTKELVSTFEGGLALAVRYDEKVIPAASVNAELVKRVAHIEAEEGRAVRRKEKQTIKENILAEFVQKALTRSVVVHAYYSPSSDRLFVATASKKMADVVMNMLIKVVGSIQTKTTWVADAKHGLTTRLKRLVDGTSGVDAFGDFEVGDSCRIVRALESKETINYTGIDIAACDELVEKLDTGFEVEALRLGYQGLSLNLTHDFLMRGLQWEDSDEQDGADPIEVWMEDAAAKIYQLNAVRSQLLEMLAYREEDQGGKEKAA